MKRYSVAPSSSRRKSTINHSLNDDSAAARAELERLEQETTLVLQEIDKNLSRANNIISDKIFPALKAYSNSSEGVWKNVSFWKHFFEQSANVELSSYEARANTTMDVNTLANSHNQFLLSDNEEEDMDEPKNGEDAQTYTTEKVVNQVDLFKKPVVKNAVEESTPTWSTEQPKNQSTKQIQSSTPQQGRMPLAYPYPKASRFEPVQFAELEPGAQVASANVSHGNAGHGNKSPSSSSSKNKSPVKTHTIRQSLDNYHRISISPRKRTPLKSGIDEDARRRSSMIQDLINSSPTLPEPPVLQSELGNRHNEGTSDEVHERSSKYSERLSPVTLPPELSPQRAAVGRSSEGFQRFPTTPKFLHNAETKKQIDTTRTPNAVRMRYEGEGDSDLPSIQLQINPSSLKERSDNIDEIDVPLPDLETIDLTSKRSNKQVQPTKRTKLTYADDNDNVFLDNSNYKPPSAASTLYHSVLEQENSVSRENTMNNSQSRSISNLFEEMLTNISRNDASQTANKSSSTHAKKPEPSKDVFEEFSNSQNDSTENSTSEMGSLLGERYKNLTAQK